MSSDTSNATDYLRNAQFSTGSSSSSATTLGTPTASDILSGAGSFDPQKLHPLAGLTDKLEYLTLDDEKTNELPGARTALPSRGWGDDLCYGTGTTYLSGES